MLREKQVLEANELFYKAFNSNDLDLMKEVWRRDDPSALCVHPGWQALKGYEAILRSWSDIFKNSGSLEIKLSDVKAVASTDLAWVSCTENLFSIMSEGVQVSRVHATNLFKLVNDQWRMIVHHASSVPGAPDESSLGAN